MMRYVYRVKFECRPFPQTFEQLDIYLPGFEIVNKKLHHILFSFFFSLKFISSRSVYHLAWNPLCIMEFANCIYLIKARELRPETRLVDTIRALSRHHCRCHNVVQGDLAQIVFTLSPTKPNWTSQTNNYEKFHCTSMGHKLQGVCLVLSTTIWGWGLLLSFYEQHNAHFGTVT